MAISTLEGIDLMTIIDYAKLAAAAGERLSEKGSEIMSAMFFSDVTHEEVAFLVDELEGFGLDGVPAKIVANMVEALGEPIPDYVPEVDDEEQFDLPPLEDEQP